MINKNDLNIYQSNNREYTVLAKASLLSTAASGSRLLVMFSSRVTMMRLHNESSSAFTSHLRVQYKSYVYMSIKFNRRVLGLGKFLVHEKISSGL